MGPRAVPANVKEIPSPTPLHYAHTHDFTAIALGAGSTAIVSGDNLVATRNKDNIAVPAIALYLEHRFDVTLP